MNRLLQAGLIFLWAAAGIVPAAAQSRLNVLLITSDDLGLTLGCYGDTVIRTPQIDALAASGVRFKVAYVAQASCSPSRAAMFTGLYPHSNGQYGLVNGGFALHEGLVRQTIPAVLKRAGYRTGIVGKLHVSPEKDFPFDFRGKPQGGTHSVRAMVSEADKFLKDAPAAPFFLMVNFGDPHASRESQTSSNWYFLKQVDGLPEKPLEPGDAPPWPWQGIDVPLSRENIANYYNCVQRLDTGIGLLMEALKAAGHEEDTLVIFVGDHGPPFARGKTTCYEAGLRVPFLARWPGVSKPGVSEAMVSTVDILPTICDATGAAAPENLQGRSLRPVLAGETPADWRTHLAAEFHYHGASPFFPRRAIRDGRYKLIHNLRAGQIQASTIIDGDKAYTVSREAVYERTAVRQAFDTLANPPEFELYDLETDPIEFHNLAGQASSAEAEASLKEALLTWREQTGDPLLRQETIEAWIKQAK